MQADGPGSVSCWIDELKQKGDHEAARRLWDRYFARLVGLARGKLRSARRAGFVEDEEDAALEAFDSLCRGAAAGRFEELSDRDDLWRLLVVLTVRKAIDQKQRQGAAKRGGGRLIGESDRLGDGEGGGGGLIGRAVGDQPAPEMVAEMVEEYRRLRDSLDDEVARQVLDLRLEGYSRKEIAERVGCAEKTVTRKLSLIRGEWSREAG